MKNAIVLLFSCFLFGIGQAQEILMESNHKARLYFTEAENRYNQNEYTTALEYIKKAEHELGETNGRILNLKIKTLYNIGKFDDAQKALALFINNYSSEVTPELRSETESYFLKLERYFEQKKEEENRREKEQKAKEDALKHWIYVGCSNSQCNKGNITKHYTDVCTNCGGSGRITKQNYAQAIANGLNGTNHSTSYQVTCGTCNGYGKVSKSYESECTTCKGTAKLLKYNGSVLSYDEQEYAKENKRKLIDYYIELKNEINNNKIRTIFPIKSPDSEKYGCCDRNLNLKIPFRYDKISIVNNSTLIVKSVGKYGLLNQNNEILMPLEYSEIQELAINVLLTKKSAAWQLFDYQGKARGPVFEDYFTYGEHLIVIKQNNRYGIMDFGGNIIKEAIFSKAFLIEKNPLTIAFLDSPGWIIYKLDASATKLSELAYDQISTMTHGGNKIMALKKEQTYTLSSIRGNLLTSDIFDEIEHNQNLGIIRLVKGSLWGLYHIGLLNYVSPQYQELSLSNSHPNRAIAKQGSTYSVIDGSGQTIIGNKIQIRFYSGKDLFIVQEKENSNRRSVYDINGNLSYKYTEK